MKPTRDCRLPLPPGMFELNGGVFCPCTCLTRCKGRKAAKKAAKKCACICHRTVDQLVKAWHEGSGIGLTGKLSLREYLGMTRKEYAKWAKTGELS